MFRAKSGSALTSKISPASRTGWNDGVLESWSDAKNPDPNTRITPSLQYSGYLDLRIAMQQNFVCAVESNARRFGAKTALLCGRWTSSPGRSSTLSRRVSLAIFQPRALVAGDRVAILLPNGVEFVVAFLAILKLGATPAPLNPLVKDEELAAFKADLRPKLSIDRVVMNRGSWQTIEEVDAPSLILYTSGSTGRPKGAVFSHDALDLRQSFLGGTGHGSHRR